MSEFPWYDPEFRSGPPYFVSCESYKLIKGNLKWAVLISGAVTEVTKGTIISLVWLRFEISHPLEKTKICSIGTRLRCESFFCAGVE